MFKYVRIAIENVLNPHMNYKYAIWFFKNKVMNTKIILIVHEKL